MFELLFKYFFPDKPEEPEVPPLTVCDFDLHSDVCGHRTLYCINGRFMCQCCADEAMLLDSKRRMSWQECKNNSDKYLKEKEDGFK